MPVRYDQDTSDDHRKEPPLAAARHRPGSAARHGMGHVYRGRAAQRRPRPMSIPDAIRAAAPRPVLIIASGASADEPVAARWFQAAAPHAVQVRVVPHAGHTQGLAAAPRAWEAHVIGFLNTALNPATTPARPRRQAPRLARQPAGGGEDDLGPESFQLVSGWLARMPSSASGLASGPRTRRRCRSRRPLRRRGARTSPSVPDHRSDLDTSSAPRHLTPQNRRHKVLEVTQDGARLTRDNGPLPLVDLVAPLPRRRPLDG